MLVASDPSLPDSDGDYYSDANDPRPKHSDVTTLDLGGGSINLCNPNNGYICVSNYPNASNGELSYGGNQGWFSDSEMNYNTQHLMRYINQAGCGIIASTDIDLYCTYGDTSYSFEEYRDFVQHMYDTFPHLSLNIDEVYNDYSAPPLPAVLSYVLSNELNLNYRLMNIENTDREEMLNLIIWSIFNNHPVVFCEMDVIAEGIKKYLVDDDNSLNDIPIIENHVGIDMNELDENLLGKELLFPKYSDMRLHYVTVTGIVFDDITNDTWLRIQSWGRVLFMNYDEIYDYQDIISNGYFVFAE